MSLLPVSPLPLPNLPFSVTYATSTLHTGLVWLFIFLTPLLGCQALSVQLHSFADWAIGNFWSTTWVRYSDLHGKIMFPWQCFPPFLSEAHSYFPLSLQILYVNTSPFTIGNWLGLSLSWESRCSEGGSCFAFQNYLHLHQLCLFPSGLMGKSGVGHSLQLGLNFLSWCLHIFPSTWPTPFILFHPLEESIHHHQPLISSLASPFSVSPSLRSLTPILYDFRTQGTRLPGLVCTESSQQPISVLHQVGPAPNFYQVCLRNLTPEKKLNFWIVINTDL